MSYSSLTSLLRNNYAKSLSPESLFREIASERYMLERVIKPTGASLQILRTGDSIGALFFRNTDRYLAILGSIISIVIFSYWTWRLFLGGFAAIVLIVLYIIAVLLAIPFWNQLSVNRSSAGVTIEYRRQGVSWLTLVEAQAGGFIIFVSMYWLISNSLVDNQGILLLINSVAIICAAYIIPFLPLLSKFPAISALKTKITFTRGKGLSYEIHPLDSRWKNTDQEELVESLMTQLHTLLTSIEKRS